MRALPSFDLHAHVDVTIEPSELVALDAVVFAVTRSLDEADKALARRDQRTVWGAGCHPGLVGAQKAFSSDRFREQLSLTPFAGELGLDGKSRVPMELQQRTLDSAFGVLADLPRITSLHSYAATAELMLMLDERKPKGVVLHWWLGSAEETARAIELDCYFSVNSSSARRRRTLQAIPLDRLLPETDHPFGDRSRGGTRRPGYVRDVEESIAVIHGLSVAEVHRQLWLNLSSLVSSVGVGGLLPAGLRPLLAAI